MTHAQTTAQSKFFLASIYFASEACSGLMLNDTYRKNSVRGEAIHLGST
jgi:hypothetical protein